MTSGERLRAMYAFESLDHLPRGEFSIWPEAIERWKQEGLPANYEATNWFNYDPPGAMWVDVNMGWTDPPLLPLFETKLIRAEDDTEIIQDTSGRWLRVFKGRRHGYMPAFIRHPVATRHDWEENVAPRLDPTDPRRYEGLAERCQRAAAQRKSDRRVILQGMVGGYMYLRALMGPEDLLYAFHDQPDLIHAMMRRWREFMNTALTRIQAHLALDVLQMGEDICYNHGLLISPDMVRTFLLPYYCDVVSGARARQKEKLYFFVDSDGWAVPAIPLYREVGMDGMFPFEVASGCDVAAIAQTWPDLIMQGGIDKRVLAAGKREIEAFLQHVIPPLVKRGGYLPTCDHGVPDNVPYENYLYYRRRLCELDH
jgi:hypothetical protein